jgi:hypothetical protein
MLDEKDELYTYDEISLLLRDIVLKFISPKVGIPVSALSLIKMKRDRTLSLTSQKKLDHYFKTYDSERTGNLIKIYRKEQMINSLWKYIEPIINNEFGLNDDIADFFKDYLYQEEGKGFLYPLIKGFMNDKLVCKSYDEVIDYFVTVLKQNEKLNQVEKLQKMRPIYKSIDKLLRLININIDEFTIFRDYARGYFVLNTKLIQSAVQNLK